VAEAVEAWWARRQFSHGSDIPYPVGTYRDAWASFPALIRQYHPEFNAGITLTQIPPAAEVLLLWQCEVGHLFAATPGEQRSRPGRVRRRSSWCPECLAGAAPKRIRPAGWSPIGLDRQPRSAPGLCDRTPDVAVGDPFASECAPRPSSAVEGQLRFQLIERLGYTTGLNAIRVPRPFFDHVEVWPDIVIPELRVAIEYDSTGRHGLEHVGQREEVDRRKDRAVRAARWEVVRIRTGKLEKLGPHDIQAASLSRRTHALLLDELRAIRGSLIVDCYLR
jgi:Probable Zinc-ribbon domain